MGQAVSMLIVIGVFLFTKQDVKPFFQKRLQNEQKHNRSNIENRRAHNNNEGHEQHYRNFY